MARTIWIVLVALAMLAFVGCERSEPVSLALKWRPGEVTRWRMASDSTSHTTGVLDRTTHTKTEFVGRQTTDAVAADGSVTIRMVMESVRSESDDGAGNSQTYDSSKDGPEPKEESARPYAAMLGVTVTMIQGADGQLKSMEGMDAMFDKLMAKYQDDPKMKPFVEGMRGSFGNDMWKPMTESMNGFLPTLPVRVGDTWNRERTMVLPIGGRMEMKTTYTLAAVAGPAGDQIATIRSESTSKPGTAQKGDPPSPLESISKMDMGESKSKGTYTFSIKQGRVVKSSQQTTSESTMKIPTPGGKEETMRLRSTIEMTLELLPEG